MSCNVRVKTLQFQIDVAELQGFWIFNSGFIVIGFSFLRRNNALGLPMFFARANVARTPAILNSCG